MRRASLLVNGLAALVALAIVLAGPPGRAAVGPRFELADAAGALRLENSRAGEAIFHGEKLRPGETTSGTVAIVNTGDVRAAFAVQAAMEGQTGAGRLWDAVRLTVTDVTSGAFPVYEGRLSDMGRLTFGGLGTGRRRAFQFTLSLPRDVADNSLQGATLSLGLTWSAQAVDVPIPNNPTPQPPTPQSTPMPAPPAPTATPTPTPSPAPIVKAEDVLSLPSPKRCISRRKFVIRVRAAHDVAVKSTTVFVNNRKAGTGPGPKAVINLRGLPRGTVKVKVVAVLSDGRQLVLRRTYKTCTSRKR
jgi:hypothetical protein